ncbi:Uncharacterised protein [Mycobacteroides abscessus subsp. abscessus]|nr:Uncharacterised protein [Mycobacteroides abscessus subsp. abscessus]
MRMSGGEEINVRRRCAGVSPERTPIVMAGSGRPIRAAVRAMPASGARRFRSTSTASALSGDTYRTLDPRSRRDSAAASASFSCTRVSMAHRNAARVLPDPVGAMTRVLSPLAMDCHAPDCARVGVGNDSVNHSRVGAENRASGPGSLLIRSSCQEGPTINQRP